MRTGWYDDNAGRWYPFVGGGLAPEFTADSPASLPLAAVVDFGCVMGLQSGYRPAEHQVWLQYVARVDDEFIFSFRSDAPGWEGQELRFRRSVTEADYAVEWVELAETAAVISESSEVIREVLCGDDFIANAFLVTGDLEELREVLPSNGTWEGPPYLVVEPALILDLSNSYVRSFNLVNAERTRAENDDDCRPLCWEIPPSDHYVRQRCLTGDLRLREGFNCKISLDAASNTITIGAAVGAGQGEPCEEVPLSEDEAPPAGRNLLTGGPSCQEVIRSINGVSQRIFQISAGAGVGITPDPENHKLTVTIDMRGMAVCYEPPGGEEDPAPPPDYGDDPCTCGPA